MRQLAGLNGLNDGQAEALAKCRDDGSRERVAVLMKPQRGHLFSVGRSIDFLNVFNRAVARVGQGNRLIFRVGRTTTLSAISSHDNRRNL